MSSYVLTCDLAFHPETGKLCGLFLRSPGNIEAFLGYAKDHPCPAFEIKLESDVIHVRQLLPNEGEWLTLSIAEYNEYMTRACGLPVEMKRIHGVNPPRRYTLRLTLANRPNHNVIR